MIATLFVAYSVSLRVILSPRYRFQHGRAEVITHDIVQVVPSARFPSSRDISGHIYILSPCSHVDLYSSEEVMYAGFTVCMVGKEHGYCYAQCNTCNI